MPPSRSIGDVVLTVARYASIGLVVAVALLAAYFQMWGAARHQWPFSEGGPLHFITVLFPLE